MMPLNLKNWMNSFFDQAVEANSSTLIEIQKFTVLWVIFEKYVCNENANYRQIEVQLEKINSANIKVELYGEELNYFKGRYTDPQGHTKLFDNIFTTRNIDQINQARCLKVLKSEVTDPLEILISLSFLIYRYRNNLFHGVKDVMRLDDQHDNFINANSFLAKLIQFLKAELNIQTT